MPLTISEIGIKMNVVGDGEQLPAGAVDNAETGGRERAPLTESERETIVQDCIRRILRVQNDREAR